MSRSQRHHLENYNTTSAGYVVAQGQIAPSILAQNEVITPGLNEVVTLGPRMGPKAVGLGGWNIPEGPSGGPLQGSSMSGAIPEGAPPARRTRCRPVQTRYPARSRCSTASIRAAAL